MSSAPRLPDSQFESLPLNFDQLRMERRRCPRRMCEELVQAVFHGERDRVGVTRLLLRDVSHSGLGCISETPLEPGSRVTIAVHGVPMPQKSGTVVRCLVTSEGFLLGVSWDKVRDMAK